MDYEKIKTQQQPIIKGQNKMKIPSYTNKYKESIEQYELKGDIRINGMIIIKKHINGSWVLPGRIMCKSHGKAMKAAKLIYKKYGRRGLIKSRKFGGENDTQGSNRK